MNTLSRGVIVRGNRTTRNASAFEYAAAAELLSCGYLISPSDLATASKSVVEKAVKDARETAGSDRNWEPMYPNFPKQVRDTRELALLANAIIHYLSNGTLLPNYEKKSRAGLPLKEALTHAKVLRVISEDEATFLLTDTITAAVAMSEADARGIRQAVAEGTLSADEVVAACLHAGNRENISRALLAVGSLPVEQVKTLVSKMGNADGLLRVLLALYTIEGGHKGDRDEAVLNLRDGSAPAVMFLSIPMGVRKAVVTRLGEVTEGFRADMLLSHRPLWRKALKSMHARSLAKTPEQIRAVDIINGNIDYRTLESTVESLIAEGRADEAVDVLRERPGLLYRRAGMLAARVGNLGHLASALADLGSRAPLTTLISAYNGLVNYNNTAGKVVSVAGQENHVIHNDRNLDEKAVKTLVDAVHQGIVNNLRGKDISGIAGSVVKDAPVSLVNRDKSDTDRSLLRGERTAVEGSTVRAFMHWFNVDCHTDLDLSVALFSEGFQKIDMVGWNSSYTTRSMTYSGDITNAPRPRGAAEFVDIYLDRAVSEGYRWAVMHVQSYSGDLLNEVDVLAGVMDRDAVQSGEIFDPRTTAAGFHPTASSKSVIPLIVDLETREMIWVDTALKSSGGDSLRRSIDSVRDVVEGLASRDLFTYGDLLNAAHAAHGTMPHGDPTPLEVLDRLLN